MSDIVISKNDEVDIVVKSKDSGIVMELSEFFTFYVPGYKFVPSYRNKLWDGKIRLYDTRNYTLPSGLLYHLERFARERGYVIGRGEDTTPNERRINDNSIPELNLSCDGSPINLRDYQTLAIEHVLKYKQSLLVSPTGSGKSLMIYVLLRWFLSVSNKKAIIVVPTTSLVEQMWKDFADYGSNDDTYDPDSIHRIYAGKEKESFEQRVVITTWQSVFKMPRSWFKDYEMVVGDEAHLFKAKSLTTIMGHLRNAWLRVGTTGTLDGTKVHKLVLEGCFGPVFNVTSTKKLIESKTLSDISIDVLHMQYSNAEKKAFGKKTYQEEIRYIVQHEQRNKFIKTDIKRKVFYVSGEVGALDREEIRTLVEKEKDAIIVASLGTFSTGINIKNLHNMIFAAPTKSQVRVLQSIGRSLRKSENGQPAKVYDLCDDFSWKKRKNYTLGHGLERIDIYEKEELNFRIHPVPILQDNKH